MAVVFTSSTRILAWSVPQRGFSRKHRIKMRMNFRRQLGFQRRSGLGGRFIIALVVAIAALISYYSKSVRNPVTGENQHISLSVDQEIAMGLQAAPEMADQFGGPDPNQADQARVRSIGERIAASSDAKKSPYRYEYHLLADPETVNAFALPGGQIFITRGLYKRLSTDGQIAGVLGHETGHVVARHSAEQIAKQQLTQGLTGAAVIASYDPNNPSSRNSAAVAALIGGLIGMKFSRSDESESDKLGVRFVSQSGYDPRSMVTVMQVLQEASKGRGQPEFLSTHPNPENRIQRIRAAIKELFPSGLPSGMTP